MGHNNANVSLCLYREFCEVRRKIEFADGQSQLTLSDEEYAQILPDSIKVAPGIGHATLQAITKKHTNLEGKTVYVKSGRSGGATSSRRAILVRTSDWLVKDYETERFFTVAPSDLEFESTPVTDAYSVELTFSEPIMTAVLSYLVRTITWKPRYFLEVGDDGAASIICEAVLKNDSPTGYFVEEAQLFGGRINLPKSFQHTGTGQAMLAECSLLAPPLESTLSDHSGPRQYSLITPFRLDASSIAYFEFLRPKISVEQMSSIKLANPSNVSEMMNRVYAIECDQFIPAGLVTVQQSGRIVGFHELMDLPATERREMEIGNDPSCFVERKQTMESKPSDFNSKVKVCLSLINNHSQAWKLRYKETNIFPDYEVSYKFEKKSGLRETESGAELTREVPSGSRVEVEFCVVKKICKKKRN